MVNELLTKPIARQKLPDERFTYNEFCARIKETEKADLIHGEIIMSSPATIEHEISFFSLGAILYFYVNRRQLGLVIGSRAAMKFSDYEAPEPDIMFIQKDRLHLLGKTEIFGPADLVVEIVSPGSRRLDFVEKKEIYAHYGVKEYWLIDRFRQQAFFWKNVNGVWQDLPVNEHGIFRSEVVAGFWLRVDWLFATEPLDALAILETILAGDPDAK
ncbi:MAG: Uma2 family endonuclease [bacterium]